MAKKDNVQEVQDVAVEAKNEDAQVMPVEKPQQAPQQQEEVKSPYQVLSPGRPLVVSNDLVGEINQQIHQAESQGKMGLAGDLRNVHMKVGDLLAYVEHLEKNASDNVKSLYAKIKGFFKKM